MSQDAFDFDFGDNAPPDAVGAEPGESAEPATLSIGELVSHVNRTLADGLGRGVWVRGEIHGFSQRQQHRYFTLVDDGDGPGDLRQRPKIGAAVFGQTYQRLRGPLERAGLTLQDGLAVRARGTLELYGPTGRLTFRVNAIDPEFTLGNLALQRDVLLRKLTAEGLVERNPALALTLVPLRVGVITSRQSDGWHDFRTNLHESGLGFDVMLAPVTVQGATAPIQIGRALHRLGVRGDLDVIAVVRGGGSKSDLATFDHERVAKAIATCPLPVITGIGHDNDRSVADHVAHTATKTPTACAQFLIDRVRGFAAELDHSSHAVAHAANRTLAHAGGTVERDRHRLQSAARRAARQSGDRLARIGRQLALATRSTLDGATRQLELSERRVAAAAARSVREAAAQLDRTSGRLDLRPRQVLTAEVQRIDTLAARLRAVDPEQALARGWTITTTSDGHLVRSVTDLHPGSTINTRVRDGRLRSTVTEVEDET